MWLHAAPQIARGTGHGLACTKWMASRRGRTIDGQWTASWRRRPVNAACQHAAWGHDAREHSRRLPTPMRMVQLGELSRANIAAFGAAGPFCCQGCAVLSEGASLDSAVWLEPLAGRLPRGARPPAAGAPERADRHTNLGAPGPRPIGVHKAPITGLEDTPETIDSVRAVHDVSGHVGT